MDSPVISAGKTSPEVFIVDFEMLSPLGLGQSAQWQSLISQQACGATITRFAAEGLSVNAAAEVREDLQPWLNADSWFLPDRLREAMAYDRKLELGLACFHFMRQRLRDVLAPIAPHRVGIALGMGQDIPALERMNNTQWEIPSSLATYHRFLSRPQMDGRRINRIFNPADLLAVHLAEQLPAMAFQEVALTACAASNQAMALGMRAIRQGRADAVLCGGSDSVIKLVSYLCLLKLGILCEDGFATEKACRPFDESRRGTLLGEGAGYVLLASEDAVKRMGLRPQFALCGAGTSLEGYKITAPEPNGAGMRRALQAALLDAKWDPTTVSAIQLHGTGTLANDPLEMQAIADVFGPATANLYASSTKDRHGHLIAAAGVQELCLLLLSMKHGLWPSLLHCEQPIATHGLNLVRGENRPMRIHRALHSSFAFGGVNSVLAVENREA